MPERLYQNLSHLAHKQALRSYRAQNSIWLWVALATFVTAIQWITDPVDTAAKSAVGRQLSGPLDDAWIFGMALAGIFISYGIWYFRVKAEIVGHMILCVAVAVNVAAIATEFGFTSTTAVLAAVDLASASRMWSLWAAAKESERVSD